MGRRDDLRRVHAFGVNHAHRRLDGGLDLGQRPRHREKRLPADAAPELHLGDAYARRLHGRVGRRQGRGDGRRLDDPQRIDAAGRARVTGQRRPQVVVRLRQEQPVDDAIAGDVDADAERFLDGGDVPSTSTRNFPGLIASARSSRPARA